MERCARRCVGEIEPDRLRAGAGQLAVREHQPGAGLDTLTEQVAPGIGKELGGYGQCGNSS